MCEVCIPWSNTPKKLLLEPRTYIVLCFRITVAEGVVVFVVILPVVAAVVVVVVVFQRFQKVSQYQMKYFSLYGFAVNGFSYDVNAQSVRDCLKSSHLSSICNQFRTGGGVKTYFR